MPGEGVTPTECDLRLVAARMPERGDREIAQVPDRAASGCDFVPVKALLQFA
jgi:hypothetical protein